MTKKCYDTFIIGPISQDENISYEGGVVKKVGGAVVYSAYSAIAGDHKVGVLTKTSKEDKHLLDIFNLPKEDIYHVVAAKTTSIKNEYLSADKERRNCTAISITDSFKKEEIPESIHSKVYHLAGLIAGDFNNEMIESLSKRGKVALDVQGVLRHSTDDGRMIFKDWEEKKKYLPYINFLKTDAAEAEILTGTRDRKEAAKMLYSWGAKEIMITHHTEVIVYDGEVFYSAPLKPRNLSGRTGRGDTCFSAYITERLDKSPEEAVLYAGALVSLKMESDGPFEGTRLDVEAFIEQFYKD